MAQQRSKLIVITGVSRGLGRGLCQQFVNRGHTVVGIARTGEAIASLRAEYAAPHDFSQVNVTNCLQVNEWAQRVLKTHGAPHLLINNAGVMNINAVLWEVPADEFERVIQVNLVGTFYCLRAFLPSMIEAGRGGVVNLSSTWGSTSSPLVGPYCASKWGVEGLSRALAQELPGELFCVALNPGVIDTAMLRLCFGEAAEHYPSVDEWAAQAAPVLLSLSRRDNGVSLNVSEVSRHHDSI